MFPLVGNRCNYIEMHHQEDPIVREYSFHGHQLFEKRSSCSASGGVCCVFVNVCVDVFCLKQFPCVLDADEEEVEPGTLMVKRL